MSLLPIEKMSWDEKLRAMEELWEALSREEARFPSPAWHEGALKDTRARYEAGEEKSVDWAVAKRDLRSRSE
jgi:hypothetical protein